MLTILLLTASNTFMTAAWYWHLKVHDRPTLQIVSISWAIALFEYCLAVPANRIGYQGGWSAGQLKITQEAIALLIFGVFSVYWLGESFSWRHAGAFACLMGAVAFMFAGK